jgi:cell wall-associated NlpC family hydrolase
LINKMNNRIKTILIAAVVSSVVLTQGVCVSAAQFDDGASAFSDGTGSVSALASTLAKQTEEQTQEFVAKEEEAAQIREERRVEKAQKASEKAEQEKEDALQFIQQTIEEAKKKAEEEARKKAEEEAKKAEEQRLAKRQAIVDFALQFEGNPYVYGGTSLTNGADCSGFVMSVFANFGYSLPRVAAAQCDASTKKDISQLEPGDLVFYGSGYVDHVALYIGDGKIIHASGAATGIKISNYDYQQPVAVGTFME